MSVFQYSALDGKGYTCKGVLEGDTARQIRQQLRVQGLAPLTVDEVAGKDESTAPRQRFRANAAELALLTRQLATLVRAGLPLEEALRTVAKQSNKARLQGLLLAVRSRVLEGHSLAQGLADFPSVFPEMYRATIAAGEQSGFLDQVLERLADYTEARHHMRRKTLLALFYPLLLTLVALLVVAGLLTYVVPQVVQVFVSVQQELPWLTRTLIQLSDFLRSYGLWLLAAILSLPFLWRYTMRSEKMRRAWHHSLLKLPIAGSLERSANTARFARTLSILSGGGVPLLDALHISANVMHNLAMREAILQAAQQVREGGSLYIALQQSGLFPPISVQLIASGENSGELDAMLERAAKNQENELESFSATLLALFEPLLILLMGGVVLVIVLAILMPVFELNQLVR